MTPEISSPIHSGQPGGGGESPSRCMKVGAVERRAVYLDENVLVSDDRIRNVAPDE